MFGLFRASLIAFAWMGQSGFAPPPHPGIGERPPEITADKWFNIDKPPTLDSLRGSVVVLEIWGPGPTPRYNINVLPDLMQLYESKWKKAGVKLITLCIAAQDVVAERIKTHKLPYPVGATADPSYAYGLFTPTFMVLDPHGFVSWIQCPTYPVDMPKLEAAVAAALAMVPGANPAAVAPTPQPPEKPIDPRLFDARQLMRNQQYGDAFSLLVDVTNSPLNDEAGAQAREAIHTLLTHPENRDVVLKQLAELKSHEYLRLARLEAAQGDNASAAMLFKRVIEINPKSAEAAAATKGLAALNASPHPGK